MELRPCRLSIFFGKYTVCSLSFTFKVTFPLLQSITEPAMLRKGLPRIMDMLPSSGMSDTVRKIVLSLLVGYPKWKVRCSVAENFPRWRYQGLSPVGLAEIQEGVTTLDVDLHTETNNFAPNEYKGVVNSSGLAIYKGSTQEIKVQLKVRTESKLRV